MKYRVSYEVDVDADSPEEAAKEAYEMMKAPDSMAPILSVTDGTTSVAIDLDALLDEDDG